MSEHPNLQPGAASPSDERLCEILRAWADEYGRTPRRKDILADDNQPHPGTWTDRWGSWSEACRAADLEAPGEPCPLCGDNTQDLANHLRHRCEGADDV